MLIFILFKNIHFFYLLLMPQVSIDVFETDLILVTLFVGFPSSDIYKYTSFYLYFPGPKFSGR